MDEAHQILLNALEHAGVVMPTGVSTIQDVGSGALVSICSQSLILINERLSFPTSLPVSMAERFRLCTDLATAIKQLGYRGDLSFHQGKCQSLVVIDNSSTACSFFILPKKSHLNC